MSLHGQLPDLTVFAQIKHPQEQRLKQKNCCDAGLSPTQKSNTTLEHVEHENYASFFPYEISVCVVACVLIFGTRHLFCPGAHAGVLFLRLELL